MTVREPIAVLGMGCRFPGAEGVDAYWALLLRGEDAVGEVPPDRWDADALWSDDAAAAGRAHCRWGGFIDGGDAFDAALFGISAHEAERMDPQQGLALELAWEALEHAGISPHGLGGSDTGVFVGVSTSDFDRALCRDLANLDLRAGTGTSYSVVANRLSYSLGLCGPSVAVDLACASSLAAVHLACQALWLGECDLALAGGVHLILSPEKTVTFSQGGVLARDGRCKAFSAAADGYVRGEGGGMVVLKRWADAERDQDPIWALIRGSALNHNGGSNGLSAPLGAAQERVLRRALAVGGVSPATIGFVEAHGTGTLIGDAIEIKALKAVLSEGRSKDQVCMIGSVKTNIGHLEAAAGIAGLIKAVLTTSHGVIPPTLHAAPVSKHLRLDGTPFRIAESTTPWPDRVAPRQAAVSSFSFGGGNAHVVIEEAPKRPESATTAPRDCLLALSARTPAALAALARRYEAHLMALASRSDAAAFADTCFTAAVGRAHFPHRLAILADGPEAAAAALRAFVEGGEHPRLFVDEAPPRRRSSLAYLYGGLGSGVADGGVPSAWSEDWDALVAKARQQVSAVAEAEFPCRRTDVLHHLALTALLDLWGIRPAAVCGSDAAGCRSARLASSQRLGPELAELDGTAAQLRRARRAEAFDGATVVVATLGDVPTSVLPSWRRVFAIGRSSDAASGLLEALARAYAAGLTPDWQAFFRPLRRRRRPQPTYRFERHCYRVIRHATARAMPQLVGAPASDMP